MSSDPSKLSERFFTACLLILLGSWALATAVEVLRSIWIPVVIVGMVVVGLWLFVRWRRRY